MKRVPKRSGRSKSASSLIRAPHGHVYAITYNSGTSLRLDYKMYLKSSLPFEQGGLTEGDYSSIPFCYTEIVKDGGAYWEVENAVEHMYCVNTAILKYESFSRPYCGPRRFKKDRYELVRDLPLPAWFRQAPPKEAPNYPLNPSREVERDWRGPLSPKSSTIHIRARSYHSLYLWLFFFDSSLTDEEKLREVWERYWNSQVNNVNREQSRAVWLQQVEAYLGTLLRKMAPRISPVEQASIVNEVLGDLSTDEGFDQYIRGANPFDDSRIKAIYGALDFRMQRRGISEFFKRHKREQRLKTRSLNEFSSSEEDMSEADPAIAGVSSYNFFRQIEYSLAIDELRLVEKLFGTVGEQFLYDLMDRLKREENSYREFARRHKMSLSQVHKGVRRAKALGSKIRDWLAEDRTQTTIHHLVQKLRKVAMGAPGSSSAPKKKRARRSQRAPKKNLPGAIL